jgi:hypothetical protein
MRFELQAPPKSSLLVCCLTKLILTPIYWVLRTGDEHDTLDRMFTSRHVKDLQLIISTTLGTVYMILLVALLLSYKQHHLHSIYYWSLAEFDKTLTFLGPVLLVIGTVLAWAYQAGIARLGVVDLFACEITTLCKVVTVVGEVGRCVDVFEAGPPRESAGTGVPAHPFTSQENYFPVFDGSARDLQTLEANVVVNITAFYTFMKAVRDSMRTLAEIKPQLAGQDSAPNKAAGVRPWYEAASNVVYMLFLGLESARNSICDLVEVEPEWAERTIVILISELEAYVFLSRQYTVALEMHHERIMLRAPVYRKLVPELCCCVEAGIASEMAETRLPELSQFGQWEPAYRLLPELKRRYQDATGQNVPSCSQS